jgi:DNA-binding beta-propeller fold protein YncE
MQPQQKPEARIPENPVALLGGKYMRLWGLGAAMLVGIVSAGCGGNSTAVQVTISPSPATILLNSTQQFAASVTGVSATTVYWQICQPLGTTSSSGTPPVTTKPTDCTPIPGIIAPKGTTVLTGYGTISQTGLYTAPSALPSPNTAVILATSTVNANYFITANITLETGVTVQVSPASVTLAPTESFQFTATVNGSSNQGVSWSVSSASANATDIGTITSGGLYTAPSAAIAVTITATSSADSTQKGTATVSVTSGGVPALTSLSPQVAEQGSVQQDVYLNGTNFDNDSQVIVTPPNQAPITMPSSSVVFITSSLLRVILPANVLATAGTVTLQVQTQTVPVNFSAPLPLNVFAVRPALIAASPDSVSQSSASASVTLTGGFFSSAANPTTATFDGQSLVPLFDSSRQISVTVPAGLLGAPGLHPVIAQNPGVAPGEPSLSALNVAVKPTEGLIPASPVGAATGSFSKPSAVAIDRVDGIAVVANSGSNSISLVDLPGGGSAGNIAVGANPTGVAVDDLLPDPVALVVNNADQTVSAVDLTTLNQSAALNVSIAAGTTPPLPYAIGVNPLTHRAIVAYQATNEALILRVSDTAGVPALAEIQTIGGSSSNFSGTGQNPAVAIDSRLNWAIITPGGAGEVSIVDLGADPNPGAGDTVGRVPQAVAVLAVSQNTQGIGIDPQSHRALLSDPQAGTLTTFTFLNNTVTTVTTAPVNGVQVSQTGFVAAAADPLEDVGIAVNALTGTADIVDLENSVVLQTVTGLGSSPEAVAIDPASNLAVIANQSGNTVSLVALSDPATDPIKPLQIIEASPAIVYGGPGATSAQLTLVGGGFAVGSQVLLDGVALPTADVTFASARKIVATVPASMLGSARRYIVQILNPGSVVSNVTELAVIQPISVGSTPVGVAVDTDRDAAVVTNSGDGTASLISLAPPSGTESPESLGPVGIIGSPILVGATPQGVAAIPRLGLAVVANNGSNNVSLIDLVQEALQETTPSASACGSGGTGCGPAGVAINDDFAISVVANSTSNTVSFDTIAPSSTSGGASSIAAGSDITVDQDPVAVAVDPSQALGPEGYAAVATDSQTSSVDFLDMSTAATVGRAAGSGLQNPTGIVFDPVNQVFLVANSLLNNVVIIDPATIVQTPVSVGIAPTSIDYDYQTSTLVTVNSPTRTLSVLNYVCPPSSSAPSTCVGTSVQIVLGLGGNLNSPLAPGANAVAIDPKLNLAVLADPDNNRVLLVPLPH